MTKHRLTALALCLAGAAHAQDSNLSVSVGVKAWHTQWTTFGYYVNETNGDRVLIQVPAKDKFVYIPHLNARYGNFVGSISGYLPTDHSFVDGGGNRRRELDVNLGYFVLPSVALTVGYKKVGQKAPDGNYELSGPVAGLSATAPLGGAFALYGALGLGRMSDTDASTVKFDADYRLAELGLAYNLPMDRVVKTLSFTLGYRIQVLSSKEALGSQDGRDLTQGLTVGLVAAF